MNPTLIAAAIGLALSAAIGFGTAWEIQAANITKINLGHANERIEQQRASRQVADRLAQQVIAAQNAAAARVSRNAADSSHAATVGNGLRITSEATVRAATTDTDACGAVVSAYGVVVDESIAVIREMATGFDQCLSDNQALAESWPK